MRPVSFSSQTASLPVASFSRMLRRDEFPKDLSAASPLPSGPPLVFNRFLTSTRRIDSSHSSPNKQRAEAVADQLRLNTLVGYLKMVGTPSFQTYEITRYATHDQARYQTDLATATAAAEKSISPIEEFTYALHNCLENADPNQLITAQDIKTYLKEHLPPYLTQVVVGDSYIELPPHLTSVFSLSKQTLYFKRDALIKEFNSNIINAANVQNKINGLA